MIRTWWKKEVWDPLFEIMDAKDYYEKSPFLSWAKALRDGLDEGLISELVFISTTAGVDGRKRSQCKKYFPEASISLRPRGHHRKTGEARWQWLKNNHPDFDLFIDDSLVIIEDVNSNLPAEKILAMPDYPSLKKAYPIEGQNIYKTSCGLVKELRKSFDTTNSSKTTLYELIKKVYQEKKKTFKSSKRLRWNNTTSQTNGNLI